MKLKKGEMKVLERLLEIENDATLLQSLLKESIKYSVFDTPSKNDFSVSMEFIKKTSKIKICKGFLEEAMNAAPPRVRRAYYLIDYLNETQRILDESFLNKEMPKEDYIEKSVENFFENPLFQWAKREGVNEKIMKKCIDHSLDYYVSDYQNIYKYL